MLGKNIRVCINLKNINPKNLGSASIFASNYSTERTTSTPPGQDLLTTLNMARYARGTSGRSSFSGNVVTVFGATGMMGRIICNRLGKEGAQLILPCRGDLWASRSVKLVGDLGQVVFLDYDLRDEEKIRRAVEYSNVVINCVGADYETSNFNYWDVHVDGPRRLARISKECGVEKFIHFSALNASPRPQQIFFKPSRFLISKWEGEQAVREEFEDAVIIRPSNIYGETDRFLYYYTNDMRRNLSTIPLWKKGEMTIKMPVNQRDVADGVMKIVNNRDIKAATYDFVGPDRYLLSEIVDYVFQLLLRPNIKRSHLTPARLGLVYLYEKVMKRPQFSLDLFEREFISDQLSTDSRNPTLKDLGIDHRKFDESVSWCLKVFNKLNYYNEKLNEFPEPKPPKPLSEDFEYQLRRKIRQNQ
ncbi:unnamed protein product [Brachionus calyciflorus]|uniref:NADH dehydrogenase [ubiquinone] 1 alpha subcomplex subunit 9, mitochondrial n=1 Tax=Brachionus calyciflorus TaxID=104777 RepID=A0A813M300_9BILA|nr:unnamed protein product [Brachionus calyciflorus]